MGDKMKKFLTIISILFLLTSCSNNNNKFIGNWIEENALNNNFIQGISLSPQNKAQSINMATLQYETWEIKDNILTLTGKSIGNGQTIEFKDNFTIKEITPTYMILNKNTNYEIKYLKIKDIKQYKGTLPAASNPGIIYDITIYDLNNNDGIFKASLTYIEGEKGKDITFNMNGKKNTLKGKNKTIIYQLKPFNKDEETMNFLYENNKLTMLDKHLNEIQSSLNYSLEEIKI